MLDPAVEARPWDEQHALDDDAYRVQLRYLFDRSAFYRDKLGTAGIEASQDAGGLADIQRLPLTEKQELRATTTDENPVGTHLCAERLGDRPDLLDERDDGRPQLHPPDRRRSGELDHRLGPQLRGLRDPDGPADRLELQRRAVRRRRGARVV